MLKTKPHKLLFSSVHLHILVLYKNTSTVTTEQNLGDVAWLRVFGGTLSESQDLVNPRSGNKERISQLLAFNGKNRERVEKVNAGDIIATIKLKDGRTNDTLADAKAGEAAFDEIPFPSPVFQIAIKTANSQEDEKLGTILNDYSDRKSVV